ncbi:MAG: sulfurase [Verrucomicrobiales bacterium]|nr:sulfurase [Verrucomicrobiales bacterium]
MQPAIRNLKTQTGRVASLHLHSAEPGQKFQSVTMVEVIEGKGIVGNPRYFSRNSRSGGPSKRQVSLIEREQIAEHTTTLGLETLLPGTVRSNIETSGIDLIALVGKQVRIGEAILFFYEPRTPCAKMDAICIGLRALMDDGKQGVMAQVIRSGKIAVGDEIVPCDSNQPA